jgi:hypothetical protein
VCTRKSSNYYRFVLSLYLDIWSHDDILLPPIPRQSYFGILWLEVVIKCTFCCSVMTFIFYVFSSFVYISDIIFNSNSNRWSVIHVSVTNCLCYPKCSRPTYSQSGPHRNSIGCHHFDQVGVDFGHIFLWVVKTRFRVSQFLRVTFHVRHLAHHILVEI